MSSPTTARRTTRIALPSVATGTHQHVLIHDYLPSPAPEVEGSGEGKGPAEGKGLDDEEEGLRGGCYIQASLHADELPGMLVVHHLIRLLDAAAERNAILRPISLVPFANPLGLAQRLLGVHLGRFSLSTGVNFNRDWPLITDAVVSAVSPTSLSSEDSAHNVRVLRQAMWTETQKLANMKVENVLKQELFKRASMADIVLDLHCDTEAILHMYTHDRLWPEMRDLCALLDTQCNLIAGWSGGNPFDEACSCPWATFQDKFHEAKIPMACQAVTVELRGEVDVSDELALNDARNLYAFLVHRGYVKDEGLSTAELQAKIDAYDIPATPLSGVDMIEASVPGVIAYQVKVGDHVKAGQLLGEIVNIEDVDAPRVPIVSRTDGIIFGVRPHKLAIPGEIAIKVAGRDALAWRTGNLLTAK